MNSLFASIRSRFHPLWRLRKFRWFRWLQKRIDFPVVLRSGRIRYRVMLIRDLSLVVPQGGIEVGTHRLLERLIRECDVRHFFDVGANVGMFAWHALGIRPGLDVRLFEPDRTNVRLLRRTIARNRLDGVSLWEGVLSDREGDVEFLADEASGAGGSMRDRTWDPLSLHTAYGMGARTRVRSTTLDAATEGMDPAGAILVKIDVERSEAEVFRGGRSFFTRCRPLVIVECFEEGNLDPLTGLGYDAFRIPGGSNFLVVPRERLAWFADQGLLPGPSRP